MTRINNILHPTDFSPFANRALPLACALARDYGATLILLHVRPMPVAVYGEFGAMPPQPPELVETVKDRLRQLLPTDFDGHVEYQVRDGDAAAEIVSLAEQSHCDLIVIGTHGRSGLSRVLMGSVAEMVLRKAPCPVLTVKQSAE